MYSRAPRLHGVPQPRRLGELCYLPGRARQSGEALLAPRSPALRSSSRPRICGGLCANLRSRNVMCAAVPLRRFLARRRRALWPRRARWSRNEKQQKRARLRRMRQHIERARGRGCERGRLRVERRRAPSRVFLLLWRRARACTPAQPRRAALHRSSPRSTFSRALQARDRGLTINSRGGRGCSRRRARSRRRRRYQPRARTRARHSPTDAAMPSARTCAGGSWTPWSPPLPSSSRSAGKARRGGATAQRWTARGGEGRRRRRARARRADGGGLPAR